MKILFFGDVIGRVGRDGLANILPKLKNKYAPDFVIANAENAAHGKGLTPRIADELWSMGVDVLTMGNHTFDKKDIMNIIDDPRLIRPANYAPSVKGHGSGIFKTRAGAKIGIVQVMGRVYMPLVECPFTHAQREIAKLAGETKVIFIDHHAEITAEKNALGWHLDGKASVVVGTHTHIQTADERILPGGTAYCTDVGACGPLNSVIGAEIKSSIDRFVTGLHAPLVVASGDALICGVAIDVDEATGHARSIERIRETVEMPAVLPENK
jgi:2',3'-cyclic-nucleotide 2'-phosphodiesterase